MNEYSNSQPPNGFIMYFLIHVFHLFKIAVLELLFLQQVFVFFVRVLVDISDGHMIYCK